MNNIDNDIKSAILNQDKESLPVLRSLKSALTNAALGLGNVNTPISEQIFLSTIRKQIKQRRDSIDLYLRGNRNDLADKESKEIDILSRYLPKSLSSEETSKIIEKAIEETAATSKKDSGKVIKLAIEMSNGALDGKTISTYLNSRF